MSLRGDREDDVMITNSRRVFITSCNEVHLHHCRITEIEACDIETMNRTIITSGTDNRYDGDGDWNFWS